MPVRTYDQKENMKGKKAMRVHGEVFCRIAALQRKQSAE